MVTPYPSSNQWPFEKVNHFLFPMSHLTEKSRVLSRACRPLQFAYYPSSALHSLSLAAPCSFLLLAKDSSQITVMPTCSGDQQSTHRYRRRHSSCCLLCSLHSTHFPLTCYMCVHCLSPLLEHYKENPLLSSLLHLSRAHTIAWQLVGTQ